MATLLGVGAEAPAFSLPDQHGDILSLADLSGRDVLVFFYPKADTPGCTAQACGLRDVAADLGPTAVVGISPDPPARQARFDARYGLGFPLLSDPDHVAAEAYRVWAEKSMYGRRYMGIVRSAFLIGATGTLRNVWYRISPKDTPTRLLLALRA